MLESGRMYLARLFLNLIGFLAGSILEATSNGLVPAMIPGIIGLLLGDLIFGATIGLAQWLVLRRTSFLAVSAWWIVASSVGFVLGARSGALLTYPLANDWLPASVVFGIFMGGSLGLATLWSLSQVIAWPRSFGWLIVSLPAWVFGEGIAFATDFSFATMPLVALSISGISGLELLRLQTIIGTSPKILIKNKHI